MAKSAMAEVGGDPKAKKRLAGAHNQLCAGLDQAGDPAAAEKEAIEAIRLDRERYQADPKGVREDLSSDLGMLGAILGRLKRPQESIALYQEQLALRRAVAEDDPSDMTAQVRVAATLDRLGNAHRNAGEPEEAIRAGQEALALIRRLWERDPKNRYLLQEWAYSSVDLALSYEKARRTGEMCAAARDSRKLLAGPAAVLGNLVERQQETVERILKDCPGS
jgi:tetratricopeptide (TPR) repeat protein